MMSGMMLVTGYRLLSSPECAATALVGLITDPSIILFSRDEIKRTKVLFRNQNCFIFMRQYHQRFVFIVTIVLYLIYFCQTLFSNQINKNLSHPKYFKALLQYIARQYYPGT